MIVITLGTSFFPFERALNWLQVLLEQKIIAESVLLQHGSTFPLGLSHPLLTSVPSLTREEMVAAVKRSSLVISHAGQGSTRMLSELGARFVLLPRLQQYGEHVDDHQLLFARAVAKFGILYCTEFEQLVQAIEHRPEPARSPFQQAPSLVEHLISHVAV